MAKLSETIRDITKEHLLNKNGRLYAQCVRAVGWIGGSVPELSEEDGIVELPTSDVSNGGVVVGASLAGERPIYVIRYQGFVSYNMITILNYAAKSLEIWNQPCPILIRGLGMERYIGPVASNMHHSSILRMPGIDVSVPISSNEWRACYERFMSNNRPYFISESRQAFNNDVEFSDKTGGKYSIFLVGPIRLKHDEIAKEFPDANIIHICHLTDLSIKQTEIGSFGVVVDSDYQVCGVSEHIAYKITHQFKVPVKAIGLEHRTAGFAKSRDNITPTIDRIRRCINE